MNVVDELRAREPIFHRPELGTDFANMIVDDYWEIGASGARYERTELLAVLAQRYATPHEDVWRVENFAVRALDAANTTFLATYDLVQDPSAAGGRRTRRATVWRRDVDGWRALYHQGTLRSD
jgi:hypothetical protein